MNTTAFRLRIQQWANATDAQLEALARQVCMEMAERAVDKTPVDTGFLRGSWQPSLNKVSNAEGQIDQSGAKVAAAVAAVLVDFKLGDRFVMMNNANYARYVEYGTSKMAGRYFVNDTVKAFPAIVAKVAQELGIKTK